MKKVILASAPEAVINKAYVPALGLLYVAAALEKSGYEVIVIDGYAEKLSVDQIARKAVAYDPVAFGITGTTENRFNCMALLSRIKGLSPGLFTLWGGPHATLTYKDILENFIDVDLIVRGEGEISVPRVLNAYLRGEPFDSIPGLAYRDKKGTVVDTGLPLLIEEIEALPWPSRHLIKFANYSNTLEIKGAPSALGVLSSRGCPNSCSFCANVALGNKKLRRRDPVKFVNEIEFLVKEYGIRGFDVWDDTLTVNRKHVEDICHEIMRRRLNLVWRARARINTVDKELLTLLKAAGCVSIGYGVESGSEPILNNIHKNITLKQIKDVVKLTADMGFIVRCFFIFSLPGETTLDIGRTASLIKELRSYGPNIETSYNFAKIYPGTELEKSALREGILPAAFSWSQPMDGKNLKFFDNNYSVPCYENKGLPLEKIKSFVISSNYSGFSILAKGLVKLCNFRTWPQMKSFLKTARFTILKK